MMTVRTFLVAQTVFLLNHVLMLAGMLGVLRAGVAGRGRLASWGGAAQQGHRAWREDPTAFERQMGSM